MHGGKRNGSGRRATKLSTTGTLKRVEAEEILAAHDDEQAAWLELLNATTTTTVALIYPDGAPEGAPTREVITIPDNKIRLEARKYLTDRRDGKPAQAVHHSGKDGEPLRVIVEHIGRSTNSPSA